MADVKISELTALASASADVAGDVLAIVDTSVPQTKKITVENLLDPVKLNKATDVIGIGDAPNTWNSLHKGVQFGYGCVAMRNNNNTLYLAQNSYYESSGSANPTYIHENDASELLLSDGSLIFRNAASGTGTITWGEKFRISSGGNVGIGEDSPLATLHVKQADSGASVHGSADQLALENSSNAGISILSGTSGEGAVYFGDSGDNDIGRIRYNHSGNSMDFKTNTSVAMTIDRSGDVGIGTTSINSKAKLHIRGGDSGQTSSSNNTQLTVEVSGWGGIQILTGTTNVGGIWVGDSNGSEAGGKLYYNNNEDAWSFYNAGSINSLILNGNGSASFAAAISTPKGVGYVVHNVTVSPGSTSTYNLNGMGGNCAIGLYAAACMREGSTTQNNTTHIGVHQHTQGSNTYSDLLTRTDNSDSTIVRSSGNLTCTNNESSVNLKFIVKYFNLISLDTSNNLA